VTTSLFLSAEDLHTLTGYSVKTRQIDQLRRMGIPFFVNACGRPVVAVSAVEGRKQRDQPHPGWNPAVLQENRTALSPNT